MQMKDSSPNLDYRQLGADWPGTCQSGQVQSPINVVVAGESLGWALNTWMNICLGQ